MACALQNTLGVSRLRRGGKTPLTLSRRAFARKARQKACRSFGVPKLRRYWFGKQAVRRLASTSIP